MIRKKPVSKEAALLRMADLCSRSEQCSSDIKDKLRRLGLSITDTEEILKKLQEKKFIDDTRFARAYASDKARFAGWGPRKIRQYLAMKRIDSASVKEAIMEIDEEIFDISLEKAARIKARKLDLREYEDRCKLMRHLLSRGFSYEKITQCVRRLMNEDRE